MAFSSDVAISRWSLVRGERRRSLGRGNQARRNRSITTIDEASA